MAKILLSLSVLFLTLSVVFGVLNTTKARTLREAAVRSGTAQAEAEQVALAKEKTFRARETSSPPPLRKAPKQKTNSAQPKPS